jgi:hypothetical protein
VIVTRLRLEVILEGKQQLPAAGFEGWLAG